MAKKILTTDEQIAELRRQNAIELEKQIEKIKFDSQVDDARHELRLKIQGEYNTLQKKHDDESKKLRSDIASYIADFKKTYGVEYDIEKPIKQPTLSVSEKAELAKQIEIDGKLKYSLNADKTALIGAKGEAITSVINFKHKGKKETISARNLFKYLNPEATKDELDRIFSINK
ncbi:hypothetical protein [Flavobacterium sp.]|uniref:hypothetical protein n=1 Tax=Flavobacterium sp. TaxID=239 RepID=UPI002ED9271F